MALETLNKAKDFSATPQWADLRSLLYGAVMADWKQAFIARGFGGHVDVGSFSTPLTGGGAGTIIDLDQPEFGVSIAEGYTMVPLRVHIEVQPGLQTTDSHESEILLAVDVASAWAGDGTVTSETPINMKSSVATSISGVSAFSAATADITDPVLGLELGHAAQFTDIQGIAATVNMYQLTLLYEPLCPPFLVGPCAMYGYWGGSIAATGFANLDFLVFPTSLISGLS